MKGLSVGARLYENLEAVVALVFRAGVRHAQGMARKYFIYDGELPGYRDFDGRGPAVVVALDGKTLLYKGTDLDFPDRHVEATEAEYNRVLARNKSRFNASKKTS